MNKNPERPQDMEELMSKTFNPNFETEMDKYKKTQKKIIKEIFGE